MTEEKTRLFTRDFILVMMAAMGTSMVNYFFFSAMSLFSEKLTGTVTFAGYLSFAYSATALIIRPVSGVISDRVGRVRILVIGAALSALSCILYGATTSLVLLLLLRVLNGIGMSMNSTCTGAAVSDIVPREKLAQGIGVFGLYSTISQAVGPFIALTIIGSGEWSGFRTLFLVSAAFCSVSFISGCFIKYERNLKREPPVVREEDKPQGKTFFGFERQVIGPSMVVILFFFGVSCILSFLTLYAKKRGFSVENVGWFFFVSSGGVLLSRVMLGKLVDKRGSDIVMIPGLLLVIACLILIPFSPSLPYLILLALPYGIASGAVIPTINAIIFKRCSPARRGAASAAYFASIDLGITLGAPVMGEIAERVNFDSIFFLSALIIAAAFLLYVFHVSDKRYERRLAKQGCAE